MALTNLKKLIPILKKYCPLLYKYIFFRALIHHIQNCTVLTWKDCMEILLDFEGALIVFNTLELSYFEKVSKELGYITKVFERITALDICYNTGPFIIILQELISLEKELNYFLNNGIKTLNTSFEFNLTKFGIYLTYSELHSIKEAFKSIEIDNDRLSWEEKTLSTFLKNI